MLLGKISVLFSSIHDNFLFIVLCLIITALVFGLAVLLEKLAPKESHVSVSSARFLAIVGLMGALSAVLMFFDLPLVFLAPEFYKLDLGDFPALIAGYALGPIAGVLCEFLKVLLKLLLFKPTSTAFIGEFSSFILGCVMILPATALYRFKKTKGRALFSLIVGSLLMTLFGSLFNAFFLIPKYADLFGVPVEVIVSMGTKIHAGIHSLGGFVLWIVVPFNLLKSILISLITMLLYKYIKPILVGQTKHHEQHY